MIGQEIEILCPLCDIPNSLEVNPMALESYWEMRKCCSCGGSFWIRAKIEYMVSTNLFLDED